MCFDATVPGGWRHLKCGGVRGGSVDGECLLGTVGVMVAAGFFFDLFWCKLCVCVVGCCGCLVRMGAAKSERARRGALCEAGAGEDVLW